MSERARLSMKDMQVLKKLREDLANSNDLVMIDKPVETQEFEKTTNSDFNYHFENELIKNGSYVKRLNVKQDGNCMKATTPLTGMRGSRVINFDEERVNSFTF